MPDSEQVQSFPEPRSPVFATTHWSVVMQSGDSNSPAGEAALERLCRTYWFPLYSFIRRKGRSEEDAKDLTQQFFTQLLQRRDLQTMDARKGKFRTFLLVSLRNFLANERDHATAAKRGGGRTVFSLDALMAEEAWHYEPSSDVTPDKLFDQRWALRLLEEALSRLRTELLSFGRGDQFEHLKSFLTDEPRSGEYAKVASQLGLTNQAVAVQVHRLRQRYREFVRAEVAQTVSSPMEVEEELRELYHALHP